MVYGVYKNVRDSAWKCLSETGADKLPISVLQIAGHFGIVVAKNSVCDILEPGQSGLCFQTESEEWFVVFNDAESSVGRQRFTIAHELGHILLGHPLREGEQHTRVFNKDRPEVEKEADMFAARILAPACVLWALDLHSPEKIANACNISISAAQLRAQRMEELYRRQKFLTSPLERQVFQKFKPWIDQQKGRPE